MQSDIKCQNKESELSTIVELILLLNQHDDLRLMIQSVTKFIKEYLQCDAIGIRLIDAHDFPLYETLGFPDEFVEKERYLCSFNNDGSIVKDEFGNPVLECMCGRIIQSKFDPSKPYNTEYGSFWNGNVSTLGLRNPELLSVKTRNRCVVEGYESVALIPLKIDNQVVGLIQINDKREKFLSKELVLFLEQLSLTIALAISRHIDRDALIKQERLYRNTLDNMLEGVQIIGFDWKYLYLNDSAVMQSKYPKEVLLKHTLLELFPGVEKSELYKQITKCFKERIPIHFENQFQFPDHSIGYFDLSIQPVPEGVFILSIDITERILNQEVLRMSEQRFQTFMNETPFYAYIKNEKRETIYQNKRLDDIQTIVFSENRNPFDIQDVNRINQIELQILNGTEKNIEIEFKILYNNKIVWLKGTVFSIQLPEGKNGIAGVAFDITKQKVAEENLIKSQELYRAIINASPDDITVSDLNGKIIMVSPVAIRIFGYHDESQIIGKSVFDFLHPDEYQRAEKNLGNIFEGKPAIIEEYKVLKSDGSFIYCEINADVVRDSKGEVSGFIFILRDVTEKKHIEKLLVDTEKRYKVLVEKSADGIVLIDIQGNYKFVSYSARKMFGYEHDEELTEKPVESTHPEDLPQVLAALTDIIQNPEKVHTLEYRFRNKNREYHWVESTFSNMFSEPSVEAIVINFRDICERKEANKKILESEERYRNLIESAPNGIFIIKNGKIAFANRVLLNYSGYSQDELFNQQFINFVCNDEQIKIEQIYSDRLKNLEVPITYESCMIQKNGNHLPVEVTASIINYSGEKATLIFLRDISDRKQAEESIKRLNAELEQKVLLRTKELSDLYNNAPCGYHSVNINGVFININDTELNWLGYSREEIIGKYSFHDLITAESKQTFITNFPVFKKQGWINDLEFEMVRKNGTTFFVLLAAIAMYDENGNFLASRSSIIDITKRKKAQQELFENKLQLESINKDLEAFSYSVSHDLKAPLRHIDGFSKILFSSLQDQNPDTKHYLSKIIESSAKMSEMINQLLTFSRLGRKSIFKTETDLNQLVEKAIINQHLDVHNKIIEWHISNLPKIKCDASLILLAVENLISNAVKFSSKKEKSIIEIAAGNENDKFTFYIRDNGVGFDMQYVDKLFGVFQRLHTQDEFEGTGIGLANVKQIIQKHGGSIYVESEENKGTTFFIKL